MLVLAGCTGVLAASAGDWETFPDGSTGQTTEYKGVGGIALPAYIHKPKGPGPFPVIVVGHGGKFAPNAAYGMGRAMNSPLRISSRRAGRFTRSTIARRRRSTSTPSKSTTPSKA